MIINLTLKYYNRNSPSQRNRQVALEIQVKFICTAKKRKNKCFS